ncbi:hypothetical protein FISHEDRAFT_55864 [Fistulina hepatica ATCC 64428]|uniref:Uncharacterized protein n=1 Tax=Fistulina hepatica ATCC 64428 TaxID=1128425 RepID=A0A0D7ALA5_9AGAR|nr:hypothetical protein FISHEDRAFT_55864 [Fistulina hepatica ATCC 64428]
MSTTWTYLRIRFLAPAVAGAGGVLFARRRARAVQELVDKSAETRTTVKSKKKKTKGVAAARLWGRKKVYRSDKGSPNIDHRKPGLLSVNVIALAATWPWIIWARGSGYKAEQLSGHDRDKRPHAIDIKASTEALQDDGELTSKNARQCQGDIHLAGAAGCRLLCEFQVSSAGTIIPELEAAEVAFSY